MIRSRLGAPVIVFLIAACSAAQEIYVSPQGDDANPGTADRPVLTIQHARDLARQAKTRGGMQAPARSGPILAYVFAVNPGGKKLTFTGRSALTLGGAHTTFVVIDGL